MRRWAIDGAFAAGLAALVAAAYAPSLKHGPRADQWCYLIDTMEVHTVPGAVAATYSYNRTRIHSPGDTDLFRPVLFALLATEKVLFEGDQPRIQVIGIALHWVVCLLLLTVLRQTAGLVP
ncbi:MAG: hypothetical protein C0501_07675, partial [Isosphaera sp.]|nr:hypothetical protein [Isosphaera sp.]